ncbi:hypothetical protein HMPREF1357_02565 [Enterococcus faecium C497]|nr:hypothetical protein HMPREF1357_02565 [Enterococcus faecium C497]
MLPLRDTFTLVGETPRTPFSPDKNRRELPSVFILFFSLVRKSSTGLVR